MQSFGNTASIQVGQKSVRDLAQAYASSQGPQPELMLRGTTPTKLTRSLDFLNRKEETEVKQNRPEGAQEARVGSAKFRELLSRFGGQ